MSIAAVAAALEIRRSFDNQRSAHPNRNLQPKNIMLTPMKRARVLTIMTAAAAGLLAMVAQAGSLNYHTSIGGSGFSVPYFGQSWTAIVPATSTVTHTAFAYNGAGGGAGVTVAPGVGFGVGASASTGQTDYNSGQRSGYAAGSYIVSHGGGAGSAGYVTLTTYISW